MSLIEAASPPLKTPRSCSGAVSQLLPCSCSSSILRPYYRIFDVEPTLHPQDVTHSTHTLFSPLLPLPATDTVRYFSARPLSTLIILTCIYRTEIQSRFNCPHPLLAFGPRGVCFVSRSSFFQCVSGHCLHFLTCSHQRFPVKQPRVGSTLMRDITDVDLQLFWTLPEKTHLFNRKYVSHPKQFREGKLTIAPRGRSVP